MARLGLGLVGAPGVVGAAPAMAYPPPIGYLPYNGHVARCGLPSVAEAVAVNGPLGAGAYGRPSPAQHAIHDGRYTYSVTMPCQWPHVIHPAANATATMPAQWPHAPATPVARPLPLPAWLHQPHPAASMSVASGHGGFMATQGPPHPAAPMAHGSAPPPLPVAIGHGGMVAAPVFGVYPPSAPLPLPPSASANAMIANANSLQAGMQAGMQGMQVGMQAGERTGLAWRG